MTKLNFDQMTRPELRKYVLTHKQDEEAWEAYMNKPAKRGPSYPAPLDAEGLKIMEDAFRQKLEDSSQSGSQIEGGDDNPA